MNNSKVFIYSVPRETATGLSEWISSSTGKKLKKTKMGHCKDGVQAFYSPQHGGLKNGLSYKP